MARFSTADELHAYLDWRDELIEAAGDVPEYGSPAFFAADPKVQAASYELHEVPRLASDRLAADHDRRVAERDASHDVAEAGRGQWTEAAHRVQYGRGDAIPREPVDRSRGDPAADETAEAIGRACEAVAALADEDRQHDAALAATDQADDHVDTDAATAGRH